MIVDGTRDNCSSSVMRIKATLMQNGILEITYVNMKPEYISNENCKRLASSTYCADISIVIKCKGFRNPLYRKKWNATDCTKNGCFKIRTYEGENSASGRLIEESGAIAFNTTKYKPVKIGFKI